MLVVVVAFMMVVTVTANIIGGGGGICYVRKSRHVQVQAPVVVCQCGKCANGRQRAARHWLHPLPLERGEVENPQGILRDLIFGVEQAVLDHEWQVKKVLRRKKKRVG